LLRLALTRYAYFNEGTNLVRGDPIPDGDSLPEITGMDLDISHSQEVAEMLSQDLAALQKVQEETIAVRRVRKDTFASKCMDIVKSTLKLTEDSPSLRKEYLEYLEEAHNNYLMRVVPKKKQRPPKLLLPVFLPARCIRLILSGEKEDENFKNKMVD
jgi:hypothetical protein